MNPNKYLSPRARGNRHTHRRRAQAVRPWPPVHGTAAAPVAVAVVLSPLHAYIDAARCNAARDKPSATYHKSRSRGSPSAGIQCHLQAPDRALALHVAVPAGSGASRSDPPAGRTATAACSRPVHEFACTIGVSLPCNRCGGAMHAPRRPELPSQPTC